MGVLFKDGSGAPKSGVQGFIARRVSYVTDMQRNYMQRNHPPTAGFIFRSCQKCEVVGGITRDDENGMVGAVELK